jgi:methylglutaconyl-CoA hydratase
VSVCTYDQRGGVATITIDSPSNKNALSLPVAMLLREQLQRCASAVEVRAVVITGAGSVFSSGWDLDQQPDDGLVVDRVLVDVLELIRTGDKPVVARVGGHAVGGALGLVAACDISIASTSARFGFGEVRLGLAPTTAAVHCVPRMRLADALELLLTGERFSAQRAVDVGLINRAVEPEHLDATVDEFVRQLLLGGPVALAACKHLARSIARVDDQAYALAASYNERLVGSAEATEGIAAFAERRPPRWATDHTGE